MDYLIRLAQPWDLEHLASIEKAAAQRYGPYLSQLGLTANQLEHIVSAQFLQRAQRQQRLWVAVLNSAIVGFVVVDCLPCGFFVVELDVLPDYGRRGIGTALMRTVIAIAQEQRLATVTLTTFRYVPWTIPFYRQLGFEIVVPADYTPDIRAIVNHEERHGFKRQVRVVMQCPIPLYP